MLSPFITSISFAYKVLNITIPDYGIHTSANWHDVWEKVEMMKKWITFFSLLVTIVTFIIVLSFFDFTD